MISQGPTGLKPKGSNPVMRNKKIHTQLIVFGFKFVGGKEGI